MHAVINYSQWQSSSSLLLILVIKCNHKKSLHFHEKIPCHSKYPKSVATCLVKTTDDTINLKCPLQDSSHSSIQICHLSQVHSVDSVDSVLRLCKQF